MGSSSTCGSTRPSTWRRRASERAQHASSSSSARRPGDPRAGATWPRWARPATRCVRRLAARATGRFTTSTRSTPRQRGGRFTLDARRPKALIFANAPGRPCVLVGAMWSMRRGERGPTPAGPIVRWHSHLVCVVGNKRGTKPLEGGTCSEGATRSARAQRCSTSGSPATFGARSRQVLPYGSSADRPAQPRLLLVQRSRLSLLSAVLLALIVVGCDSQFRGMDAGGHRRRWILRQARASRWIFAGTGLHPGDKFVHGGIEIDGTTGDSPAKSRFSRRSGTCSDPTAPRR